LLSRTNIVTSVFDKQNQIWPARTDNTIIAVNIVSDSQTAVALWSLDCRLASIDPEATQKSFYRVLVGKSRSLFSLCSSLIVLFIQTNIQFTDKKFYLYFVMVDSI